MEVLRCRSSAMVKKEILMHFIAYNAIRLLIVEAAAEAGHVARRLSFKGSVQALRQWEPQFSNESDPKAQRRLMDGLDHRSPVTLYPIDRDVGSHDA
jgi:hypothetical protein